MALQKLDKKQVPQVAMLAVLSCGVLGYFAKQMITPSPAAAHSAAPAAAVPPSPKETKERTETRSSTDTAATSTDTAVTSTDAAAGQPEDQTLPPDVSMRDPFQQTVSASGAAVPTPTLRSTALVRPLPAPHTPSVSVPFAPPLPSAGAFGSMRSFPSGASSLPGIASHAVPAAPAAPAWTVTGVLTSGAEHVAILRFGSERRFVRQGEWLDGQFQVAQVGRDSVTLNRGTRSYVLPLGGEQHSSSFGGFIPSGTGPTTIPAAPASAPVPRVIPQITAPSEVSMHPAVREPEGHPMLASMPPLWAAASHPARQSALVKTLATPRLALSTSTLPSLLLPTLRPLARHGVKPVVKVAAFRAKSIVRRAAPHGMLALGTAAPDFTLPTLEGHTLSLSQLQGHPVVLTFWASWVGACGSAMPALQKAASDGHAAFVGVGTWDSRPALLSFAQTHRLDTRSLLCDDSVANLSIAVSQYKVPDVPACYILDSEGRVAAVFVGFAPGTAEAVRAILLTLEAS